MSSIRDVTSGFMSNPLEVILILVMILVFVLVVLGIFLFQNRRMRQRLVMQSARSWTGALGRHNLSGPELSLMQRAAQFVSDPDTKKHLVLTNQATFNHCVGKLLAAGGAKGNEVAALRIKLGFARASTEKRVTSTAILPAGIRLFIVQRESKKFYGTLIESTPDGLVIKIDDPEIIAPGPGSEMRCYFNVKNGTFHFQTSVKGLDGQIIRVDHSEKISRTQRRRYYRARTNMQGHIGVGGSSHPPTPTRIFDLSGGGASIENPDLKFNQGDDIMIQFKTEDETEYKLIAEVRRLSRGGRTIHAGFGPMGDATRDRLISFVLSRKGRKTA
jgi:hypothetical protein